MAASQAGLSGGIMEEGHPMLWHDTRDLGHYRPEPASIQAAASKFAETHRDLETDLAGGFLSALKQGSYCMPKLRERVTFKDDGELMAVFSNLMHRVNPSNPGGPVAYGAGSPDSTPGAEVLRTRVALDVQDVTLVEAFSALSRQAPGVVWVIGDEPPRPGIPHYCRLHLYANGLLVSTGWVLKWEK